MMNDRECYNRVLRFQKADYIPNFDFGPMNDQITEEWHAQGLPRDQTWATFFPLSVEENNAWSISFGPIPGVPGQGVIEDDAKHTVTRDSWGRVTEVMKRDGMAEGAHHIVRNGVENRDDWEKIRRMFRSDEPKRYPDHWDEDNWAQRKARWTGRSFPLIQWAPSMVGDVKEVMGFENFCIMLCMDPGLVEEIMETRTQLALDILGRAFTEVEFDCMHFWEDIAFKNGPILPPDDFERLAVPRYKRLSGFARSHGIDIISVDSDGDMRLLIPGWLKGGVNHFWPMEASAGMDVVAMRKEYGQAFTMRGGINKFALRHGKESIDRELGRIEPVVAGGGYIPSLDHQVPDGVSFDNYCYYMEKKRELLGIRSPRRSLSGVEWALGDR